VSITSPPLLASIYGTASCTNCNLLGACVSTGARRTRRQAR
jgi:hypothetical protein